MLKRTDLWSQSSNPRNRHISNNSLSSRGVSSCRVCCPVCQHPSFFSMSVTGNKILRRHTANIVPLRAFSLLNSPNSPQMTRGHRDRGERKAKSFSFPTFSAACLFLPFLLARIPTGSVHILLCDKMHPIILSCSTSLTSWGLRVFFSRNLMILL